jgi:hypothetical protein
MLAQEPLNVILPIIECLRSTLSVPERLSYLLQLTSPLIVIDGGSVPFSITCTSAAGDAVAAILTRPQTTMSCAVFVHEAVTTQNKLIAHAERLLFQVAQAPRSDLHSPSPASTAHQLSIWSGRELCHFADTDNELLGIRVIQGAELDALLRKDVAKAGKACGLLGEYGRSEVLEAEARACRALETGQRVVAGR